MRRTDPGQAAQDAPVVPAASQHVAPVQQGDALPSQAGADVMLSLAHKAAAVLRCGVLLTLV